MASDEYGKKKLILFFLAQSFISSIESCTYMVNKEKCEQEHPKMDKGAWLSKTWLTLNQDEKLTKVSVSTSKLFKN